LNELIIHIMVANANGFGIQSLYLERYQKKGEEVATK
jgi:hypothetical protein